MTLSTYITQLSWLIALEEFNVSRLESSTSYIIHFCKFLLILNLLCAFTFSKDLESNLLLLYGKNSFWIASALIALWITLNGEVTLLIHLAPDNQSPVCILTVRSCLMCTSVHIKTHLCCHWIEI
jgi:hypothetical protein